MQVFPKSANFLNRKINDIRKIIDFETRKVAIDMSRQPVPTELELIDRLRREQVSFTPLSLGWEDAPAKSIDGIVRMSWQRKTFRFAAECKRQSSPKVLDAAIEQVKRYAAVEKLQPLLIVPYLNEAAINAIEAKSVSGIDLCGNGLVVVPGEWYVRRSGTPSPFRAEGTIKNVYRRGSSVVARLFLVKPVFDSVQDAHAESLRRGGRVTLSTISKVCKRLEEDLIIVRKRGEVTKLSLIQSEKLLDRLAANYAPADVKLRVAGKLRGIEPAEFRNRLRVWAEESGEQVTRTGACSVGSYAVMARGGVEEYYCSDVSGALRALGGRFEPAERFATVCMLEAKDEEVYFDCRDDLASSPVQTFLELMTGDKRDKETADQVRTAILNAPLLK